MVVTGRFVALAGVGIALCVSSSAGAADPLPRARPESVGMSTERLTRITEVLRRDVQAAQMPGAVVAVARRGKLVYFEAIGFLDAEAKIPMPKDAIFSIASMTKPFVGVGTMLLEEEGSLHLADPVARYLPAFGKVLVADERAAAPVTVDPATPATAIAKVNPFSLVPPRSPITVHDLLRHTAGMVYGSGGDTAVHKLWPRTSAEASFAFDGPAFLAKLASLPLRHHPATVWEYSLSIDVAGLVIESLTKRSLGQFLATRLWQPLGMIDTGFVVPPDKVARFARALPRDPVTGAPQAVPDSTQPRKFECGGGCAVSTAADYLRFAQMLLDGGRLGRTRLLGRKAVELMTSDHLGEAIDNPALRIDPTRAGQGFGLTVGVRTHAGLSPFTGSVGEFGWGGANGTQFWVDPRERLVVVFMAHTPGAKRAHYRRLMSSLVNGAIAD